MFSYHRGLSELEKPLNETLTFDKYTIKQIGLILFLEFRIEVEPNILEIVLGHAQHVL